MTRPILLAMLIALLALTQAAGADEAPPQYDEALAQTLGADDYGMRSYVLVILKTGPNRIPDGPERDEMFRGHFANMTRLSDEGKLALAATDPVIIKGEMLAEYHKYYGSAALMLVKDMHKRVAKKSF